MEIAHLDLLCNLWLQFIEFDKSSEDEMKKTDWIIDSYLSSDPSKEIYKTSVNSTLYSLVIIF